MSITAQGVISLKFKSDLEDVIRGRHFSRLKNCMDIRLFKAFDKFFDLIYKLLQINYSGKRTMPEHAPKNQRTNFVPPMTNSLHSTETDHELMQRVIGDVDRRALTPDVVMQLQRLYGNQRTRKLISDFRTKNLSIQREVILDEGLRKTLKEDDQTAIVQAKTVEQIESIMNQMMSREDNPLRYEIGVIKTDNGDFHLSMGEPSTDSKNATVKVPADLIKANKSTVVTHNHPGGDPLSKGDILVALKNNAQEIRATGKFGLFSFKRKGPTWGKLQIFDVMTAYATGGINEWKSQCPEDKKKYRYKQDIIDRHSGNMPNATFDEDFTLDKHFACKVLVQNFGDDVEYTHPDEEALIANRLQMYEKREGTAADERSGARFNMDLGSNK